ncbi:MAG: thioesterase family protein [bacterium]|nr:thioesterase family protein [Acidimicrobiia bacterium]MCY4651413.1 thioesterase family protein [bacterium]
MNDYIFDCDTNGALEGQDDGRWTVRVSDLWNIEGVPNGGFLMALCLAAAGQQVSHPDPLSMNSHFLGRTMPGEATIRSRAIKRGRSLSVTAVDLIQNGRVSVTSLITWGELSGFAGPTGPLLSPPELPEESEMQSSLQMGLESTFTSRFDYLMPRDIARGAFGQPTGNALARGRMRFTDGRPADLLSMPLIADGFPPAIFQLGYYGWAPTLELTIHFRSRPARGWLTLDLTARHLLNGTFEEDCYIWDSKGDLVAMSRQLGRTLAG